MDGAQDKIKRIGEDQVVVLLAQIRLQSQFHADGQIDLICKLFFHDQQTAEVFLWVKFKTDAAFFVVIIHMIGQAKVPDSPVNGPLNHSFRGNVAVSGKRGMYMVV